MMHLIISILQICFCVLAGATAMMILKSGRVSILAVIVLGFIALDSFGLALAPHLPMEEVQYLNNAEFLIRSISPFKYLEQCASHWIFLAIATIFLYIEFSWKTINETIDIERPTFWASILFVSALVFFSRYFFFGPGLTRLLETELRFDSTSAAIAHRMVDRNSDALGKGDFLASIAGRILFPLAAAAAYRKKCTLHLLIVLGAFIGSFMYALQTRQKSPLIVVFILYVLLWVTMNNQKSYKVSSLWKNAIVFIFAGAVGGWALYMVNFGLGPGDAMLSVIHRVFLVPGMEETNYFVVFPNLIEFRGIQNSLSIPLGWMPGEEGTSIYDIAETLFLCRSSHNASLLAVAWSGAGFLGIVLVSFLLSFSHLVLDWHFRHLNSTLVMAGYCFTLTCLGSLSGGAFIGYYYRGGFVLPLCLVAMSSFLRRPQNDPLHTKFT